MACRAHIASGCSRQVTWLSPSSDNRACRPLAQSACLPDMQLRHPLARAGSEQADAALRGRLILFLRDDLNGHRVMLRTLRDFTQSGYIPSRRLAAASHDRGQPGGQLVVAGVEVFAVRSAPARRTPCRRTAWAGTCWPNHLRASKLHTGLLGVDNACAHVILSALVRRVRPGSAPETLWRVRIGRPLERSTPLI